MVFNFVACFWSYSCLPHTYACIPFHRHMSSAREHLGQRRVQLWLKP